MDNFSLLLDGLQVLVVDPHADSRRLLSTLFALYGVETFEVETAQQAIDLLSHTQPYMVISELYLPDQGVYSLMDTVKKIEHARHIRLPAIALTSFARDCDRSSAIAAGFSRYVSKPCNLDDLLEIVADLAHREPYTYETDFLTEDLISALRYAQ
ncbi:response regulator [Myxacorys almedinensis]|uniref:Response regulator n=1 Tax=Myxacorys almedinensis A TaxID=2690445 RepID=A0A8J7Z6C9_9CYAN|nr:response regulator [Myxacorys almedinensis]NDJ16305.1 response regulator [Myxacorys almedinensis A]